MGDLLRQRDYLIIFVVIATACILLFDRPSLDFSLEPAWYIDQRTTTGRSNSRSELDYHLVPPVLTDLDGDGSKELIVVTKDLQLRIFSAEVSATTEGNGEIYHPELLQSVRLNQNDIAKGRTPITLKTGYIVPYIESQARTEVIVVLREDWTVSVFDSLLNLLWEKPIAHKAHKLPYLIEFYEISDISVNVYPISISEDEGAYGVIVIGASMALRTTSGGEGLLAKKKMRQYMGNSTVEEMMRKQSDIEHFSIYALDAHNGNTIWRHDGLDVKAEQYSKSLPKYAFSLNIRDLMSKSHHAAGLNDWTIFRQSLIDELPHYWGASSDTSSRMAHFVRRHMGARAGQQVPKIPSGGWGDIASKSKAELGDRNRQKQHTDIHAGKGRNGKTAIARKLNTAQTGSASSASTSSSTSSQSSIDKGEASRVYKRKRPPSGHLLDAIRVKSVSDSASLPHDATEHTVAPNVLVAHTKNGLEVVSLRLGTPITSIALDPGKTYADVDGDGNIDYVLVLGDEDSVIHHGREFGDSPNVLSATSQYGRRAQKNARHHNHVKEVLGCTMVVVSGIPAQAQLFNGSVCQHQSHFNDHLAMDNLNRGREAKMTAQQVSSAPPLILRGLDRKTMKQSRFRNIFTAINTGIISSFSGNGDLNWQVSGGPLWTQPMAQASKAKKGDEVEGGEEDGEEDDDDQVGSDDDADEMEEEEEEDDEEEKAKTTAAKKLRKQEQQLKRKKMQELKRKKDLQRRPPTLKTSKHQQGFGEAAVMAFDHDAIRVEDCGSHLSLDANSLLIVGEFSLQLRSRDAGTLLAKTDIPNPIIGLPVLGDFDNDGVVDVIVVTPHALLGYRLQVEQLTPGLLVAVFILALFAVIVFMSSVETVVSGEEGNDRSDPASRLMGQAGKSKPSKGGKGVLQLIRSTDEHLD